MKRVACAVLLALLAGCGGAVLPQVHDQGGRLELARRLYAKGDAALAVEALAPFSTSGSGSANVDEAVYLLGLCHLKMKEFSAAQADFERMMRDYPESYSAPSAASQWSGWSRRNDIHWSSARSVNSWSKSGPRDCPHSASPIRYPADAAESLSG